MQITVLTYLEHEGATQHDSVVDQVADSLRRSRHDVSILGVHGDVHSLIAGLHERKPELVFNLMEMFGDDLNGDVAVVGLLEILGIPYTGGGPGEFYLRSDKALAKKLLAFEGVQSPDFAVFTRQAGFETGGNLRMPMFVKPLRADASIGIDGRSLVHTFDELVSRVQAIHNTVDSAALAEEFVDGREFYVGVIGNDRPVALPPIEVDFTGFPADKPRIMDQKAKFERGTEEFKGTKSVLAKVSDELQARLWKTSLDAYRALRVRDYGRVDLRLAQTGELFVIEVNASCYLEQAGEFAMAAQAAGIEYDELINRIVDLATERAKARRPKPRL
jgi:D-alanine-D-alanine ligase